MWHINKYFHNGQHPTGKSGVYLKHNTTMHPQFITYPITWEGYIDNQPITIIQKSSVSQFREGYEFTNFPVKYSYMEGEIISWIDDYLRCLD